jgi:hypothetical protein
MKRFPQGDAFLPKLPRCAGLFFAHPYLTPVMHLGSVLRPARFPFGSHAASVAVKYDAVATNRKFQNSFIGRRRHWILRSVFGQACGGRLHVQLRRGHRRLLLANGTGQRRYLSTRLSLLSGGSGRLDTHLDTPPRFSHSSWGTPPANAELAARKPSKSAVSLLHLMADSSKGLRIFQARNQA